MKFKEVFSMPILLSNSTFAIDAEIPKEEFDVIIGMYGSRK